MDFKESPDLDEYLINNHGIIGDTYSCALVTIKGTIDWCTFPRIDSPPLLSSLLDRKKGGEFRIGMNGAAGYSQRYRKHTNILETVITSGEGTASITDFMPVEEVRGLVYSRHEIHRIVKCSRGRAKITVRLTPRFNFGRDDAKLRSVKTGCMAQTDSDDVTVLSRYRFRVKDGIAYCTFTLKEGESTPIILRWNGREPREPNSEWSSSLLRGTAAYWKNWVGKGQYAGEWKEQVIRSALVLKMLTYNPTGAICAAPTTSLPESIGHRRNWDYRFSWIRDSTYALWSFHLLGHEDEERKYLQWLLRLLKGRSSKPEGLRVMYTVEGDPVPQETDVFGFAGYKGSRPVREGNGATDQSQMDIYGSIIDSINFTFHPPERLPDQLWRVVDGLAAFVARSWEKPDAGIWEMRNGNQRHTHSAMMSWLALYRASEMAGWIGSRKRQLKWARTARAIRKEVLTRGFNREIGAFTNILGGGFLDASVLMMPLVKFIRARDPKFASTLRSIEQNLMGDGFVYRYLMDDALDGKEGAFIACTFWHVIALALQNNIKKAAAIFENALAHSNHLGLFSEEINPATGEFLGNFPQALSHMWLINAALYMNLRRRRLLH